MPFLTTFARVTSRKRNKNKKIKSKTKTKVQSIEIILDSKGNTL